MRLLIAEDEKGLNQVLVKRLEGEHYTVDACYDGEAALDYIRMTDYDAIILDIMMPKLDGMKVLKQLRGEGIKAPVLLLTARDGIQDRVSGLDCGADDYMVKPFEAKELIARIKAVMRRSGGQSEEKKVSFDNLVISLDNYSVLLDGKPVEMPPKEIELLYFLASRPGKVFTREQLLEQVWGFDFFGDSRTVDVHVKRIREKLGERDEWQLKTVWGVGYKFDVAK